MYGIVQLKHGIRFITFQNFGYRVYLHFDCIFQKLTGLRVFKDLKTKLISVKSESKKQNRRMFMTLFKITLITVDVMAQSAPCG